MIKLNLICCRQNAPARVAPVLLGAAEHLQEDALLDVLVLVDGGGDGAGQPFVDVGFGGQLPEIKKTYDIYFFACSL